MKKIIILTIMSLIGLQISAQVNDNISSSEGCNMIENFESTPIGSMGNWQGVWVDNEGITIDGGSNVLRGYDSSGATYLYNTTDFPSNLLEAGCQFKYDVRYKFHNVTTKNSLWLFNGSSPSSSSITFKFELYNGIVSGSTYETIIVPLVKATDGTNGTTVSLPANTFGEWQKVANGDEHNNVSPINISDINAFNSLIQNTGGIAFLLDENGPLGYEDWYFDNFCITPCPPVCGPNMCCQVNLGITNAPGTQNPLPVTSGVNNGIAYSYSRETFQVYNNIGIPITELRVAITDIQYNQNYEGCAKCVNNPALWGTLLAPVDPTIGTNGLVLDYLPDYQTHTGNLLTNHESKRELIWRNSNGAMLQVGDQFEVHYILPPPSDIPCCITTATICIKITYKDANCNVCEINTCSNIELR